MAELEAWAVVRSLLRGARRNWSREERLFLTLKQRADFVQNVLANGDALAGYLKVHPHREGVLQRMAIDCSRGKRRPAKRYIDDPELCLTTYLELSSGGQVEPSCTFTEVPAALTLCEMNAVRAWYVETAKKGKLPEDERESVLHLLDNQVQLRFEYLQTRHTSIFGRPFSATELSLEQLLSRKAPVPLRPAWKAKRLQSDGIETPVGPLFRADTGASSTAPDPTPAAETGGEASETGSSAAVLSSADGCDHCSVENIYQLAGSVSPRQPDAETPRHTFPGQLSVGEDIYYDYAVLVPIDDCATCGSQDSQASEDMITTRLLSAKVGELAAVLEEWHASGVLGTIEDVSVVREIATYADSVAGGLSAAGVQERRRFRKGLRQYASAVRVLARTELLSRSPEAGELERKANELAALVADVKFTTPSRILPQRAKEGDAVRRSVLVPEGATLVDAEYEDLVGDQTDAYLYPRVRQQSPTGQWDYFGPYMRSLGPFAEKVRALKASADSLAAAILALGTGTAASVEAFRELLSGWINEMLLNLADLLDQMAETLPLAPNVREEGSVRVGLQLVYRQYWVPQGYVRGKLVGYKNLIPNQKDSVFRRTLVRTTTETTTAEQFDALRQSDTSRTQRETSELLSEVAADFKLTQTSSGHFEVGVWGISGETSINAGLRSTSQAKQSMFAEVSQKGSTRFNEKRETKIRQLSDAEDVTEVRTELHNTNAEITANYFYYQLLREYRVSVELHDIVPVLMRTKPVPAPAEIDDHFVARYLHVLAPKLPSQLAKDAMENVEEVDFLAKELFRTRAVYDQRREEYERFRAQDPPLSSDFERFSAWLEGMRSREVLVSEVRTAADRTAAAYARSRSRLDRVISHVRENRLYYLQFIWQHTSVLEEDELIMNETYCGQPLPEVTRGLMRRGYLGREEIFEYTGHSLDLFETILERLVPGSEIGSLPPDELRQTTLFQYMSRFYPQDSLDELVARIRSHAFVDDFTPADQVLSERYVQVAQDALVVETLPGQIPLLEGFKMAHRMLDVQRACLENAHLRERISDRPWKDGGADTYAVRRYDGSATPTEIAEEA